jgi:hypothetical protein
MYPAVQQHRFGEQGEYLLQRFTRGGQRRIMQHVAVSLTADGILPDLLQALDGDNRYWEGVLRECLKEAPAHWWEEPPRQAVQNGATPAPVLSFELVPVEEFQTVIEEAAQWFSSFRQPEPVRRLDTDQGEPQRVDAPQALPQPFRGQAS